MTNIPNSCKISLPSPCQLPKYIAANATNFELWSASTGPVGWSGDNPLNFCPTPTYNVELGSNPPPQLNNPIQLKIFLNLVLHTFLCSTGSFLLFSFWRKSIIQIVKLQWTWTSNIPRVRYSHFFIYTSSCDVSFEKRNTRITEI